MRRLVFVILALAAGIPAGLVRLSCGLESAEDLIADIASWCFGQYAK